MYDVGKRGGKRDASTPQSEIDSLLVRLTSEQGRRVVSQLTLHWLSKTCACAGGCVLGVVRGR